MGKPVFDNKTNRKSHPSLFCLILLIPLFSILGLLVGCSKSHMKNEDALFRSFTEECFKDLAASDSIRLHFTLAEPEKYGLSLDEVAFEDISLEGKNKSISQVRDMLDGLSAFDRDKLSQENQLTYDLLERKLNQAALYEDYALYPSYLGSGGLPSQIQLSLTEFYLEDGKDVETYLALLETIPSLFDDLVEYEQARRKAGLICPPFILDNTLAQLDHLLNEEDGNQTLLVSFEERLAAIDGLQEAKKQTYRTRNHDLYKNVVIPAYRSLKKRLENWGVEDSRKGQDQSKADSNTDGQTVNGEGLCQYEKGKDYYKLLLAAEVGTEKSPEQCVQYLDTKIADLLAEIASLSGSREDFYGDYLASSPILPDYKEILSKLQKDIGQSFPPIKEVNCKTMPLPLSLSGTSAAAFYLIPPIDTENRDIIYINQARTDDGSLFSTLAHEGYPGHLYQHNYYKSTDPDPLRWFLGTGGYDEGWGTYAQLYSYQFMEFKDVDGETQEALRQFYRDTDLLSISLSALSDLYVNYMGYDRDALADQLSPYGITAESASSIYDYVVENPVRWLNYCIGYYEIEDIKKEFLQKQENDSKDTGLMSFHKRVLECGSCPFDILKDRILF